MLAEEGVEIGPDLLVDEGRGAEEGGARRGENEGLAGAATLPKLKRSGFKQLIKKHKECPWELSKVN